MDCYICLYVNVHLPNSLLGSTFSKSEFSLTLLRINCEYIDDRSFNRVCGLSRVCDCCLASMIFVYFHIPLASRLHINDPLAYLFCQTFRLHMRTDSDNAAATRAQGVEGVTGNKEHTCSIAMEIARSMLHTRKTNITRCGVASIYNVCASALLYNLL